MNEREQSAGLAATPGYRYADVDGERLYVAGQVPLDAAGALVGRASARLQAQACLDNLALVMGVHGFVASAIRQLTIYVVGDQDHLRDAWDAVRTWFDGDVPPATLLGVAGLGYVEQLVEIDAIVVARAER